MTPPLFLVDELPSEDELHLTGEEGRHAARVKRIGVGETILVSDGQGRLAECTVTSAAADGLVLAIRERRTVPAPNPRLVVVQALPKGDRAELAVELLTELGVDEIVPWAAERAIVQWHGARGDRALEKWRRTAREASKQSRRARVADIAPLATTDDVARRCAAAQAFVLHEEASAALASARLADIAEVAVIVGPEGGIAPHELATLTAAGAVAVRVGPEVLRTSTAGAAALAVLSVRLRRWTA